MPVGAGLRCVWVMNRDVSLDDKYALDVARAYITGIEALVRLPILQHQRDLEAGLNTAGFVTGYRGSPVGALDQAMWRAQRWLDEHHIRFQAGVNEDMAATAVWGSQQLSVFPRPKYEGVFSMWYGKGPGVDRSMDAIKHANMFGTSRYGGVLAVAGDDHACKSSTLPHQSEHMFIGAGIPVLNPADVQEVLDYGLHGWALSRFAGSWVGMKAITENMDAAISAAMDPDRIKIRLPQNFDMPQGGLNARWPATPLEQEQLQHEHRIPAALAYAAANDLNRIVLDSPRPRLGIVTTGKSWLDLIEALEYLGIDRAAASAMGIRIFKVGMTWPLEPTGLERFAKGLEEILVLEEKRDILESQVRAQLYNWPADKRPVIVGKQDEKGKPLVPSISELNLALVARAVGSRIMRLDESKDIVGRLQVLDARERRLAGNQGGPVREPYYCSGCPHNRSTKVPDGSIGMAGIGCHYMVTWMDRNTELFTQMGGEGAAWTGMAPFSETEHVFQNIGDGTYFHSGLLAIRAAIAAGVNITYKVLYNDAVAMTGGQPVDGSLTLAQLVEQLKAEGVVRVAVVAEDVKAAASSLSHLSDVPVHPRSGFEALQREFRQIKGTSALVYDQTCAAEKRRRRKRKQMPQSPVKVFINPDVCEGCGDCSAVSNCLSVLPKKTELGLKREIDQSACNSDFSCLEGFCPSFVTLEGATALPPADKPDGNLEMVLPEPSVPSLDKPWNVLITGVGGTGVLTVGGVLSMAAHLEGKGCTTLHQTGLAQKFGAVVSHVRIAASQPDIHAVRIPNGSADLLLGCDLVVAAMPEALARLDPDRSHSVINSYEHPTAQFIRDRDYELPGADLQQRIGTETGADKTRFVNATRIARELLGDSIGGNLFMLGFAWQNGLVPVGIEAIERAIELNAVAVDFNLNAFIWGRRAAVNLEQVESLLDTAEVPVLTDLDDIIAWRSRRLTAYQDEAYAARYRDLVQKVRQFESELFADESGPAPTTLTEAVAHNYFKLLAYKDEYEVARLFTEGTFLKELKNQYGGKFRTHFHLAPPVLAGRDPVTGHPTKRRLPSWLMRPAFTLLARLKFLRATGFDPFGHSAERKSERQLIADYEADIEHLLQTATVRTHKAAVAIAALPDMVRGFGHIKAASIEKFRQQRQILLKKYDQPELVVVHST